ncbi:MAG: FG-GAP-like repeat-containing protein [Cecembia sp.]
MNYLLILWPFLFTWHSVEPQFEIQEIDNNVAIGYGIVIGDVDGDGKPDILLADKKEFVWYRNGDWKRFVMIENLTEYDNVCIAARDINGDGKVEIVVGAQWNPGETSDKEKSGSVHYLVRPEDPTKKWKAVELYHEPTVHRMRWAKTSNGEYHLIMVPLHGIGNKGGEGDGVNIIAYKPPKDWTGEWNHQIVPTEMHMTHNLEIVDFGKGEGESVLIGGKEGIKVFTFQNNQWQPSSKGEWLVKDQSFGELRMGQLTPGRWMLGGIEPIHGNMVTAYLSSNSNFKKEHLSRLVLDDKIKEGHGLLIADFLNQGRSQLVIGWRAKNDSGEMGIKMYYSENNNFTQTKEYWIDKNGMSCEDLQMADLDGDGKLDMIAAGRSTNNLRIYWNRSN